MCKFALPSLAVTVRSHPSFHSCSRFKENEEDWYRAYGSAIIQGHKKLKDMIQASRKVHSNGGEHRRFLLGEALATE